VRTNIGAIITAIHVRPGLAGETAAGETAASEFLLTADLLPEAMLLVALDGRIAAANRAAARLLGETADALAGRRLHECSSNDADKLDALLLGFARSGDLLPGTLDLRQQAASPLACRCEGTRYRGGAEHGPLVFLRLTPREEATHRFVALSQRIEVLTREIARRRRAEAALYSEHERLRVTLASIGDAVIVTDTRGRISFMNAVAEALTGWPATDACGLPLEQVFVIVNQDTRATVESPVAKVLREGTIVGLANHTVLIARDGSERPIDDSGAPVRDDQGRMIGVVMVFHDVSERNALEHALRRQADQLLAADRRKDEFLAMLAHELRNPLAPLSNGVHLLRGQVGDNPQAARVTEMMQRQLHHLTRLVNDLLDVSRITRGQIVLQKEPIALADALRLAIELARPLIDRHGHRFETALPPESMRIDADITRAAQVFANLLANAAKYTPRGGLIELHCVREGSRVRVSVRDNGIGLPADLIDSVFELFQQADRSLDRSQGGLGIGLTVARALVEMHGGHITARSDGADRGSEFVVWLPLRLERDDGAATASASSPSATAAASAIAARPAAATAMAADAVAAELRASHRILVVDDNIDAARTLGVLVEHWGHSVQVVHRGEDAVGAFLSLQPDVVLLDIGLPGMDGFEIARRLRRLAEGRPLRIIAVTGYGRDDDRRKTTEAGFDLHLVKPLDITALQELLDGD
jgi:PAS domain S-box-containing protein